MPDAVLVVGPDGIVAYANGRLQQLTGWSPSEVVGKPVHLLVPERLRGRHGELVAGYFADPTVRQMGQVGCTVLVRSDGSELPVDIALNAMRIGEDVFAVASVRDDSKRRIVQQELNSTEQALREREALYEAVFARSLDAIVLGDDDARFLEVNTAAEELFGGSREELVGRSLFDFVGPRDEIEGEWRRFLSEGHLEGVMRIRGFDGGNRVAEFAATTNVVPGLHLAALRDITDRHEAQLTGERRGAMLRAIASATEGFLKDPDWGAHVGGFLEDLGKAADAHRASVWCNGVLPDGALSTSLLFEWDAPGIPRMLDDPTCQDFPWVEGGFGEWIHAMHAGEPVTRTVSTAPESEKHYFEDYGQLSSVYVPIFVSDEWWGNLGLDDSETEREWTEAEVDALRAAAASLGAAISAAEARRAISEHEEFLRTVIETEPECVKVVDPEGRIVEINAAGLAMLDAAVPDQIIGASMYDLIVPEDHEPFSRLLSDVLAGGSGNVEFSANTLAGRRRRFESFMAPIGGEDPGGSVLGITRDVTDQRAADEQLRASYEQLRRTDRERRALFRRLLEAQDEERRRIAADVHDDSVQVLTAMRLRLDLLKTSLQADPNASASTVEKVDQLTEMAESSIAKLRRLIFELRPPALEREGLAGALRASGNLLEETHAIRVIVRDELVGHIPIEVAAQAYRIAQEALSNVRRHSEASYVEVELTTDRSGVLVTIKDDGVGFDAQGLPNRPGHAGLAGMSERAEMNGGWFRVESSPSAGTTVTFWLPAGRGAIGAK
jgi:PAS domain S-box-containing protein